MSPTGSKIDLKGEPFGFNNFYHLPIIHIATRDSDCQGSWFKNASGQGLG
jgi:hypothetical protein